MRLSTGSILNELKIKPENQIFYKQLTDEEAKIVTNELLDCLRVFDEICRENQLTYMILAGGLIGLIREGSLLPWDDDIDLVMPKDDYRKFQEAFNSSKYAVEYCFKYPEDNIVVTMGAHFYNRKHSLTKLISEDIGDSLIYESYAYLDILPLDSCSDNFIFNKIKGYLVNYIQMGYISRRCFAKYDPFLIYLSRQSFELRINLFIRRLFALPFLLFPKKLIFRLLDLLLSYQSNTRDMTISYGALRYFGEELPKSTFLPVKNFRLDDIVVMIPNDPHHYLKHRYGDYMKAPSRNEKGTKMVRLRGDWEKYLDNEK